MVENLGYGHVDRPVPGEDVFAHADLGGPLLRHRAQHPAEDRRQPGRGAEQPVGRAALAQADGREDQGPCRARRWLTLEGLSGNGRFG